MAFLSDNLHMIREVLDKEKVYYKADCLPECGINQIFFFDPDGNVYKIRTLMSDKVEKNLSSEFAEKSAKASYSVKLPMTSFNHIVIEVLSLEKSKTFYVDILGFEIIPRPPFECEGYWLNGYGYIMFNLLVMK